MQLPFTHDQFLEVFAAYNEALWYGALALWVATVVLAARWLRAPAQSGRAVSWLLVVHWAWSGLVYHIGYFRAINPAALVFGLFFVVQAILLAALTGGRRQLDFVWVKGFWGTLGLLLIGYGLVYPLVGLALGLEYPLMPTFGVPCPTVILTTGFLLTANLEEAKWIAVIPLLWTAVGGSAAFVLGIQADVVLALAGVLLLARLVAAFGGDRRSHA